MDDRRSRKKWKNTKIEAGESHAMMAKGSWVLYLFLLPATVVTFLFAYLPMFSNYIAFLDYDFNNGWFGFASPFVGFAHFRNFLTDPRFHALLWRTLLFSVAIMAATFPVPLVLALMLNELRNKKFMRSVQTISYIPHFVSWVTVGGLVYLFLSVDRTGLVNNLVQIINPEAQRTAFMHDASNFLPMLILTEIWKSAGWGTILYFAALTTIDPGQYEAAEIDGAGRWKRLIHVTFPGLVPTFCILLIFSLGGLFATNFDQVFNLQNQMIRLDTDTVQVFTFYQGIQGRQYSYAAAVGLFQGLIAFILLMTTNAFTKKASNVGII